MEFINELHLKELFAILAIVGIVFFVGNKLRKDVLVFRRKNQK